MPTVIFTNLKNRSFSHNFPQAPRFSSIAPLHIPWSKVEQQKTLRLRKGEHQKQRQHNIVVGGRVVQFNNNSECAAVRVHSIVFLSVLRTVLQRNSFNFHHVCLLYYYIYYRASVFTRIITNRFLSGISSSLLRWSPVASCCRQRKN